MSAHRAVVIGVDGRVIELADQARAHWLAEAENTGRVVRSRRGEIVRIELEQFSDDEVLEGRHGNPRHYSHDHETETNPRGVWDLRHLDVRDAILNAFIRASFLPAT